MACVHLKVLPRSSGFSDTCGGTMFISGPVKASQGWKRVILEPSRRQKNWASGQERISLSIACAPLVKKHYAKERMLQESPDVQALQMKRVPGKGCFHEFVEQENSLG